MSTPPSREERLAQVVREAREQATPEPDWARVEAALMSKLAHRPSAPPLRTRSQGAVWAGLGLAAAAAAVLWLAARPAPAPRAETPLARPTASVEAPGIVNGDTLGLSAVVASDSDAKTVEHAGRARWVLEPHSSASLSEKGEHLTVTLLSGALSARVTPSQTPETFAVEVGKTRFAVHGTAFRLQLAGERVTLTVSEGVVAVEAVGSRAGAEFLLRANSRGEFALDGRTGKVEGDASVVSSTGSSSLHTVLPARKTTGRPPAPATPSAAAATTAEPPAAPAPLPEQLSIADVEAGVSSAVEIVNGCFRKETEAAGIAVIARTGMTLHVTPEGRIDSVSFGPALAPTVEACAAEGLRAVSFARSAQGANFTRMLELSK